MNSSLFWGRKVVQVKHTAARTGLNTLSQMFFLPEVSQNPAPFQIQLLAQYLQH